jgi:3'-phosphoadenosine 5'-phosphosulfate sulfotransferase (PAPS reductase)/FAD synthetase
MEKQIYHIGVSGGKDSTALLLWAVHESGLPRESLHASFCDTGNEHKFTYDHVQMLAEKVFPIKTLKPERDFYELAQWKKRFPSPKARFCTQHLKMIPSRAHAYELCSEGRVMMLSGVRSDESEERSRLEEKGFDTFYGLEVWRPLLRWKFADVLAIHRRHGIPLNPLYSYGASRVGCFPCIMSRKSEIRTIAENFPERIDAIRTAELSFDADGNGISTFFPRKMTPERFRSRPVHTKKKGTVHVPTIDDVVRWSKTERGGKQYDFNFERRACPSTFGACE